MTIRRILSKNIGYLQERHANKHIQYFPIGYDLDQKRSATRDGQVCALRFRHRPDL